MATTKKKVRRDALGRAPLRSAPPPAGPCRSGVLRAAAGGRSTCYVNKPSGKLFALGGGPLPAPSPLPRPRRSSPPAPLDTTSLADGQKTKPGVVLAVPAVCSLLATPEVPRPSREGRPGGPAWEAAAQAWPPAAAVPRGHAWGSKLSFSSLPPRPRHFGARCRSPPAARRGNRQLSPCVAAARRGASAGAVDVPGGKNTF